MNDTRTLLPYWLWPGDSRPPREIDDEIAEELRLHVDLLAEENERRGMPPDTARREAENRFGDLAAIERRCRYIKRGEIVMLQRVQAVLTLLLLVAVVFVGVRQWNTAGTTAQFMDQTTSVLNTIQNDMARLRETLSSAPVDTETPDGTRDKDGRPASLPTPRSEKADVTGTVLEIDGTPIENARVQVALKTWPNSRYRQEVKMIETDQEGRFVLPEAVPLDSQYGINVAILAPGHAIASQYVLVQDPRGKRPDALEFRLTPSTTLRVKLTDTNDKPLARALVGPLTRNDAANQDHVVYFQGSEPVHRQADESGVVELDWFAAGDLGKVSIKPRGGTWTEARFVAPGNGADASLEIGATVLETDPFGPD